ncbi:hypothetical protein ABID70_000514 [Clavibacter michiganensis]|uniref:hypothetical protein n=1 Tax=Clavibacter michiganensis TaxID=28447 RepID=UPI001AE646E4|nr:hypothetical protein [Clavibacter michiganensis]MBP2457949.1 hypothetical protein [Clavibacter michiganensis]MDQ0410519.1 hypothetical protein [Clavibacter michiganensis]
MTADDTTADARGKAEPAEPGHGKRELARIGARAIIAWTRGILTLGRVVSAGGLAIAFGLVVALLLGAMLRGADDGDGTVLAAIVGLVAGAVAAMIPLTIWMSGASRRIGSATGAHPHWRDGPLLERAVDARGRVSLAPGTAERVAVESRRAMASSAVGVPAALLLLVVLLVAAPVLLFQEMAPLQLLFILFYMLMSASTLGTQSLAAGRMSLLRDAADAELALPESERTQAPPVVPPHGSRLP